MKPVQTIINLWSGPRNISTAMMYAFSQRRDTRVIDEPLYAHYLRVSGVEHPGKAEILAAQNNDGNQVMENFLFDNYTRSILFLKQMTHHLVEIDLSFLEQSKNILLIRDPKKVLQSYSKVITDPTLEDIGIKQSAELFDHLQKAHLHVVVIDADTILKDPESALKKLCAACDIPFLPVMLSWVPGPKKADGVWAKYWYENVHQSSGFQEYLEADTDLLSNLQKVYDMALPYYQKLKKQAI